MANSWIDDVTMRTLNAGLDGLSARQQVISRNLANVDTPGYRAQTVSFEDTIRRVLDGDARIGLKTAHARHLIGGSSTTIGMRYNDRPGGSFRTDENNVDIDVELTEMSETGIQYQALTQLASKKLMLLKTIANSR